MLRSLLRLVPVAALSLVPLLAQAESVAPTPAKPFVIEYTQAAPAQKGQPATVAVTFKPAKGYHLNMGYPTSLKLATPLPAGVSSPKPEHVRADAVLSETEGRFTVQLVSSDTGNKTVPGLLAFAVCTDTTCEPIKQPVSIPLAVK